MKTSKIPEAAALKALIGLEPDSYSVEAAPSGRLYTIAHYNEPKVWIDSTSLKLVGITSEGEEVAIKFISEYRGDESFESEQAKMKKDFFKPVDEKMKEKENENN